MQKYIDAHCHILSNSEIVAATDCGVGRFIVNSTRQTDWVCVAKMADGKGVYGAIGIHPWFVSGLNASGADEMIKFLIRNPHLMVGETGLDKNYPDMPAQESVFRRHLQIAHDMGRVIHVHCVGCWGKVKDILKASALPPAIVFHGFSASHELVSGLAKTGAYFSFGPAVLDTRRPRLWATVASMPENRILVESDAPGNAASTIIPDVVRKIAQIRGVNDPDMADKIYTNTMGLLK